VRRWTGFDYERRRRRTRETLQKHSTFTPSDEESYGYSERYLRDRTEIRLLCLRSLAW